MTGERLPVGASICAGLRGVSHGGTDRDELEVLALALVTPFETDTDHTVRAQRIGLGLHARHRIPARAIRRVGKHGQLRLLPDAGELVAHVIDRNAHNKFYRLKPGPVQHGEFIDRQVRREYLAGVRQPFAGSRVERVRLHCRTPSCGPGQRSPATASAGTARGRSGPTRLRRRRTATYRLPSGPSSTFFRASGNASAIPHRSGSRSGQAIMPTPSSPLSDMTVMLSPASPMTGPSGYIESTLQPRRYNCSCGPGTFDRIRLYTGLYGMCGRIRLAVPNIVGPPNWLQSCSRVGPIAAVWSFAAVFPAAMVRIRSAGSLIWLSNRQNIHVVWLRPGRLDLSCTEPGTVATSGLSASPPRSSRNRRKTPAHSATTTSLT